MKKDILFSPFRLGKLQLKNRFVMTSMEIGLAHFDGKPSRDLIDYFAERARGDAGLICTGICRINDINGVTSPRQLSISHNSQIPAMRKLTERIHNESGKIILQLHHPGRQTYSALVGIWPIVQFCSRIIPGFASLFPVMVKMNSRFQEKAFAPSVVSASDIPCGHVRQKTRALRIGEVRKLVRQFVKAAGRAQKAGFDGIELHASHGYLIQQFLSPYSNKRSDCYGGSPENRMRFLKEIIEGVRRECGKEFPLLVRLTVEEFIPENEKNRGITLKEGVLIAKELEILGVDALDISSGSYEKTNKWLETASYRTGWRKNLAAAVKEAVSIPILASNLIRSTDQAVIQLEENCQDLIGMGRPFLADAEIVKKIRESREQDIRRCITCCSCFESLNRNAWTGGSAICAVNPLLIKRSSGSSTKPAAKSENIDPIIIIGAGPAGLQSAETLSERGIPVILFEQKNKPGGQLMLADKPPLKERISWCTEDMIHKLKQNKVDLRFNTIASISTIEKENPRAVILATGGLPIIPPIVGSTMDHVYSFDQILSGEAFPEKGDSVVIIGSGMTGLETAEYLAARGKKICIVEMAEEIAPGGYYQHKEEALEVLSKGETEFLTNHKLLEIHPGFLILENIGENKRKRVETDAVVLALGSRSNNGLQADLEKNKIPFHVIGDAKKIGKITDAIHQGYQVACSLC